MKKILVCLALVALLVPSMLLRAADTKGAKSDYDEDTYGPAAPIIWDKPVAAVEFRHKVHTMKAGLSCDSCHDDLFQMEAGNAEQSKDFTMKSIYDGRYCGACHDGSTAFAANTRCTSCHIGVRGKARLLGASSTAKGEDSH